MNFINTSNKQGRRNKSDDSFLDVLISVSIIVGGFLLIIAFLVGSIWLVTEGINALMAANPQAVAAYQNLNQLVRSLIESVFIIIFVVFLGSVLIWANIKSKK